MPATFICTHCGEIAQRNTRLQKDKPQKYCSLVGCQNARRREWKKRKYQESEDHRSKRVARQKEWRENYPADQYQKNYRESHPDYVARNRELQRQRNEKRKVAPQTITANPKHSLNLQPGFEGGWVLCEYAGTKIVNVYALSVYSSGHEDSAVMGSEVAKIVNGYALMARAP